MWLSGGWADHSRAVWQNTVIAEQFQEFRSRFWSSQSIVMSVHIVLLCAFAHAQVFKCGRGSLIRGVAGAYPGFDVGGAGPCRAKFRPRPLIYLKVRRSSTLYRSVLRG